MKQVTFTGETSTMALSQAKQAYGDDIAIVSSRQVIPKSMFSDGLFEVVVLVEDKDPPAPPKPNDDVILKLSQAVRQIDEIQKSAGLKDDADASSRQRSKLATRPAAAAQNAQMNGTPSFSSAKDAANESGIKDVKAELAKLADKIKLIQNTIWDQSIFVRNDLVIPPEFAEIYRAAKTSEIASEHLNAIMSLTLKHMPVKMRSSSDTVKNYFKVLIRRMTPIRPEIKLTRPDKKIFMLVGATGVGKTTTLAKLAAKFAIKENYKVGIITLDTYRIGAVEHIMFYARTMKLPMEQVNDPSDFSAAIDSLRHCDYIFIDTAGCSQHDEEKLNKIKQFLDKEHHTSIDVTLCLAANTKLGDLKSIYRNFSRLGIDSIIATKLDETSTLGNLFSLVYDIKKPLSYFSIGQEVPDDLIAADGDYFVNCLLEGFSGK
ncbi:MAG: flagellar biosynthesis protein FlhF [Helicobacteraceae bacterium]